MISQPTSLVIHPFCAQNKISCVKTTPKLNNSKTTKEQLKVEEKQ